MAIQFVGAISPGVRQAAADFPERICSSARSFSSHWQLLHVRVLRFGLLQDGDVGIGVLAMAVARHLLVNVV
jgi:hypothetical protein